MLYVAKALSVVLIVGAHMPFGGRMPAESIRVSICQIGVAVFFVCTGFFYRREEKDSKLFWIKKKQNDHYTVGNHGLSCFSALGRTFRIG